MGYVEDNIIEFHGETFKALGSDRASYVCVNGVRYDILPKTHSKFKNCSNAREYAESIELFAYSVLIEKSVSNDEYFAEYNNRRTIRNLLLNKLKRNRLPGRRKS